MNVFFKQKFKKWEYIQGGGIVKGRGIRWFKLAIFYTRGARAQ